MIKDDQIAKISTSLLRYTEIIPADKAFYEAGMDCRKAKKSDMAMIFLNRFLDLVEVSTVLYRLLYNVILGN